MLVRQNLSMIVRMHNYVFSCRRQKLDASMQSQLTHSSMAALGICAHVRADNTPPPVTNTQPDTNMQSYLTCPSIASLGICAHMRIQV